MARRIGEAIPSTRRLTRTEQVRQQISREEQRAAEVAYRRELAEYQTRLAEQRKAQQEYERKVQSIKQEQAEWKQAEEWSQRAMWGMAPPSIKAKILKLRESGVRTPEERIAAEERFRRIQETKELPPEQLETIEEPSFLKPQTPLPWEKEVIFKAGKPVGYEDPSLRQTIMFTEPQKELYKTTGVIPSPPQPKVTKPEFVPSPSAIEPLTFGMKAKGYLKYYGGKAVDIVSPEIAPRYREEKITTIKEPSPTGVQATQYARPPSYIDIGKGVLPPTQELELEASQIQTQAFIKSSLKQQELQEKIYTRDLTSQQAQREMDRYTTRINKDLQKQMEEPKEKYYVAKAKYQLPATYLFGAGVGVVSAVVPPLGVAYFAGSLGKTALRWGEVQESFMVSPKASFISMGGFTAGALTGGAVAGLGKRAYLKSQYAKEIKTAQIRLKGLEIPKGRGGRIVLRGGTEVAGKKIGIKTIQDYVSVGKEGKVTFSKPKTTVTMVETPSKFRVAKYEGVALARGKPFARLVAESKSMRVIKPVDEAFKGTSLTGLRYEALIKKSFRIPNTHMIKIKTKLPKMLKLEQKGFAGYIKEVSPDKYLIKGGEVRAIRVYKKGGVSHIARTNIQALIKRTNIQEIESAVASRLITQSATAQTSAVVSKVLKDVSAKSLQKQMTKSVVSDVSVSGTGVVKIKKVSPVKTKLKVETKLKALPRERVEARTRFAITPAQAVAQVSKLEQRLISKQVAKQRTKQVQKVVPRVMQVEALAFGQAQKQRVKVAQKLTTKQLLSSTFVPTTSVSKITPQINIPSLKGIIRGLPRRRKKRRLELTYAPTFTEKIVGIEPVKIKLPEARKLLKGVYTGFELIKPVRLK